MNGETPGVIKIPEVISKQQIEFEVSTKYKVLSLFSGGLGLDIGLEQTGRFKTVACVESDAACCGTALKNRDAGRFAQPDLLVLNSDISQIDPVEVLNQLNVTPGQLDMVVGGPPCQSFSVIGKRRGTDDARGLLIFDFIRFIEVTKPRTFLMENVRGLLSTPENPSATKGSLFRVVQECLEKIGYRTDTFLVNSANYGAPQIRERLIMVGNRFNLEADFPKPTHSNRPEDRLKPFLTLGDAIFGHSDLDPSIMDFSERKKRYLAMVPAGGNWRSLPLEIQKEAMGKAWYLKGGRSSHWRKLSYEFPCPTIVTMPNHAGTCLCHPEELRALTVGECARIQGFPPGWEFSGTVAEKYKQVGNAVPVVLGEVAGQAAANLLDSTLRVDSSGLNSNNLMPSNVIHLRPHVRTRWWWKDGKVANGLPYSERPGINEQALQLQLF